jgi:hypothetical protein
MGLSWQQGPLSSGAMGRFLVPEPLPKRLLYIEPLRRRMRVRFGGTWIADSERALLLFEPGRYPVAYFPETDVSPETLEHSEHTTRNPDLGDTSWYIVKAGEKQAQVSCKLGSRSPGRPWMLSMKKTNEFWATPQIATIVSTSARPLVISLFAMATK